MSALDFQLDDKEPPRADPPRRRLSVGGSPVDAMRAEDALETIVRRATSVADGPPLEVVSVNLDHIHHFGLGGRWRGTLEDAEARGQVDVLYLIDGSPIARRASSVTGVDWPRLAGSDLIGPLLARLEEESVRVGFLGGRPEVQASLARVLPVQYPNLQVAGMWSPTRAEIESEVHSARLAAEIAKHQVDVLVLGLGKPRQEIFGFVYGELTGARVLLAFGAVVDFLAGAVPRAPRWMSDHSLEWAYRLAREPRRLARRYLVEGPPAYAAMRSKPELRVVREPEADVRPDALDVAVVVVTHNNEAEILGLLDDLPTAMGGLSWRLYVKDNGSTDSTLDLLRQCPQADIAAHSSNLGYARALHHALTAAGEARTYLVLKPGLRLEAGTVGGLWQRANRPAVGAAVPLVLDRQGVPTPSLRFTPTLLRAVADAVLGDRFADRPRWITEVDHDRESYRHAHPVDSATGACILINRAALKNVITWDEQSFSGADGVDYVKRVQEAGYTVWFEPGAVVRHEQLPQGQRSHPTADRASSAYKHRGHRQAHAMQLVVTLAALGRGKSADRRQDRHPEASTR